jgi:hypothetical protein
MMADKAKKLCPEIRKNKKIIIKYVFLYKL